MRISDWSSDVCSSDLAVRLEAGEDARRLIPYLDRLQLIEVSFPRFRDGRGFSSARILREAGYKGELRAEGCADRPSLLHAALRLRQFRVAAFAQPRRCRGGAEPLQQRLSGRDRRGRADLEAAAWLNQILKFRDRKSTRTN